MPRPNQGKRPDEGHQHPANHHRHDAPESAAEREAATAHGAGVGLTDGAAHGEDTTGAGGSSTIDTPTVYPKVC